MLDTNDYGGNSTKLFADPHEISCDPTVGPDPVLWVSGLLEELCLLFGKNNSKQTTSRAAIEDWV